MSNENNSDDGNRNIDTLAEGIDFYLPVLLGFFLLLGSLIIGYYENFHIASGIGLLSSSLLSILSLQRAHEYENGFRTPELDSIKYSVLAALIIVIFIVLVSYL